MIFAEGNPFPKGSFSAHAASRRGAAGERVYTGKVAVHNDSKQVKVWETAVLTAAAKVIASRGQVADRPLAPAADAVRIAVCFVLARPKAHYRTGKFADLLRDDAPVFPVVEASGDLDKLERATYDALVKAGVMATDAQICWAETRKRYVNTGNQFDIPGAEIEVSAPGGRMIL